MIVNHMGHLFRGHSAAQEAPVYVPFIKTNFSGTLYASTSLAQLSPRVAGCSTYSNEIAGPFLEAQVAKQIIPAYSGGAGTGNFGGKLSEGVAPNIVDGTSLWMRIYHYIPSSWCSGYSTDGFGWGNLKLIRVELNNGSIPNFGPKITIQLGELVANACQSAAVGPSLHGATFEDAGGYTFTTGTNKWLTSPPVLPRDQWFSLQFKILFKTDNTGHIQYWIDNTFAGETSNLNTLPAGSSFFVDQIVYGDVWNGGSHSANTWYIQQVLSTIQQPNTYDAESRPFISPSTKASDFI
jgi:hypothetical protein